MHKFILFTGIEAYVKTPFAQLEYTIKKTSTVVKYGVGSITDGTYKLEINIKNYDDYFYEIEKGNAVQIQGFLRKKGKLKIKWFKRCPLFLFLFQFTLFPKEQVN